MDNDNHLACIHDAKPERLEDTTRAIHNYLKSDAFTDDLCDAFTDASRQARQQNELAGIAVHEEVIESVA